MEFVILVVVFIVVLGGTVWLVSWSDTRTKLQYKPKWVQHGSDDARMGYRRTLLTASWIQEFYDEGYDAVINEKEDANA